jgi:hypothetical protein
MSRELTDNDRCKKVDRVMADVRALVATDEFEVIRPARWRHRPTGKEIETGYTRGEGRVRIYKGSTRQPMASLTFLGGPADSVGQVIDSLFPPTIAA